VQATGYLNFLLNLFVMELEEKVRSRGFDDERVHDEALHSFSNAGNQVVVFIRLKTKDEIVRVSTCTAVDLGVAIRSFVWGQHLNLACVECAS